MPSIDYISKLPAEILGEIFSHCASSCSDAPLILSAVCRTFHSAARVSPQIWGRLRLSISEEADIDRGAARKAEMWFSMAGARTLDVSVEIPKASPILDECHTLVYARGAQVPVLSSVLHQRRERIRSLALRAYTERQAHSFLDSICAPSSSKNVADDALTLRRLTLLITSDLLPIEEQQIPAFIPLLSSLTDLNLTCPSLPNITAANLNNLQTLAIIRPIRSHPLPLESIVDVLRASHVLVRFELETRLDLPLETSPSTTPFDPSEFHHSELITMPALTHLSLRTNNNPVLLSRLVVPDLHTLHLNALDGKRPGRAEETAAALRQMLTRMDIPAESDAPEGARGIEILELAGVSICRTPRGKNGSWEWCFGRMRQLRQISARNMDAEHLIEVLSRPSVPEYMGDRGRDGQALPDNAVCPRLERLAVAAPEASVAMRLFKVARPYVKVASLGVSGAAVYGWDNEDALKPKSSARALISPPVIMKDEAGTSSPTRPHVFVGGFGFGSSFSRMRTVAPTNIPQPNFETLHHDLVN